MEIKINAPKVSTSFKTEKIYPELEELTVTPSTENQSFTSSKDGFSSVTVAGDNNLKAENIKSGVSLFGVNGINADTTDADATSNDIRAGKTAYVKNEKIAGTLESGNAFVDTNWSYNSSYSTSSPILRTLKRIEGDLTITGTSAKSFFRDCRGLVSLPYFDASNITDMDYLCWNCTSLVEIPVLNTSNVTTMKYAFASCNSLKTLPNLDTSSTKDFSYMFNANTGLITAPAFNTSAGNVFTNMFYGCTSIQNVPVYDFSGVIWRQTNALQSMFQNCANLSDESLNNIMASLMTATGLETAGVKSLAFVGLTSSQATRCQSLSNYQAFIDAGLITGY